MVNLELEIPNRRGRAGCGEKNSKTQSPLLPESFGQAVPMV